MKTNNVNHAHQTHTGHNFTTTRHKIDKITYVVMSRPSDTAKDTIEQKIEKLIVKDLRKLANTD